MDASLTAGNVLNLRIKDPGWLGARRTGNFIPDHNHLMHLYMIRWPQMDVVFHLHPDQVSGDQFTLPLPTVPAGDYHLYADVVHASGFPETMVANTDLPAIAGRPLSGDDAEGQGTPVTGAGPATTQFVLPDGYTMVWNKPAALVARQPTDFTFTLLDRSGHPAENTALYMGMLGHAAFVKTDGTVFAHIHPSGTASMAALMIAQSENDALSSAGSAPKMDMAEMPGMTMDAGHLRSSVSFPYGFPTPGRYRIFVQMKHASTVETGIFDASATAAP
jgi:hypothetical protein